MSYKFNPFTGTLDLVGGTGVTTWKPPVVNPAALPTVGNLDSDARVTQDTDEIWVWDITTSRWKNQTLQEAAAIGSTPNARGYSIDEDVSVADLKTTELTLQPADSTNPGVVTIAAQNLAGNKTFDDDVIITGDLTVNGTTTTINTATLDVEDHNITINKNGSDITAEGAGLTVERAGTDGSIVYENALAAKFKAGALGSEIELANVSSSQTLTNKTIDADNNIISNLEHGNEVDNPSSGVHGVTGDVVGTTDTQTLTNKTIDADSNSISNIDDNEIKAAAGIDATKIGNGDVTNTELSYINGVTSDVQVQIDGKADQNLGNLTSPTAVNQHLLPDTTSTRRIGSPSQSWEHVYSNIYQVVDRTTDLSVLALTDFYTTTPSGVAVEATMASGLTSDVAIITVNDGNADAVDTNDILIETGNKTAGTGDSGNILLQTGTSVAGVRGKINLNALEVDVNASQIKNVVDPTVDQDAATKKYVDDATALPPGDLSEVTFALSNSQVAFTDVTGVAFANGVNRSAELQYSIEIDATADLYESGKILAVQRGADWTISQTVNGDNSQILFDMTSVGQLRYKGATYAGFVSGALKVRAITTTV